MLCRVCKAPIPKERVEATGGSDLCIDCAADRVGRRIGFMDYGHKTAPSLVMLQASDTEAVRRATRAFRRAR
jgi:hypothetical protein